MYTPGELKPQHLLTARRKRAFLSFRRKSDLVWFGLSLILFSGGATALGVAVLYFGRGREPLAGTVLGPPSLAVPEMKFPLPTPPAIDEPKATPPLAKKPIENLPALLEGSRTVSAGARARTPSPLHVEVKNKRPPPPGKKAPVPKKKSIDPKGGKITRGGTIPDSQNKGVYLLLQEAGVFKAETNFNATLAVDTTRSEGELALQLTYALNEGVWVQCFVNVQENFSNYSRVQFLFKGEGANNTLEFKMVDSDGTNVGIFWPQETGKKTWTVVNIPLSDLTYLWGGDSMMELKRLRQIFFAVSKKPGDQGGRGRVIIRGIKFL